MEPHQDLRRSVERNLRCIVAAIAHPQAPLNLAAPRETGRRRAHQGVPLPEVLQAYRVSFATLWDALVATARRSSQPGTADALLSAASMIWQLTDEHAVALTEAYRAATAELLVTEHQRRSALVEALLTGHPGPEAGPWEAATLLGLPPDAHLVVVAADTTGQRRVRPAPHLRHRRTARSLPNGSQRARAADATAADATAACRWRAAAARISADSPARGSRDEGLTGTGWPRRGSLGSMSSAAK